MLYFLHIEFRISYKKIKIRATSKFGRVHGNAAYIQKDLVFCSNSGFTCSYNTFTNAYRISRLILIFKRHIFPEEEAKY